VDIVVDVSVVIAVIADEPERDLCFHRVTGQTNVMDGERTIPRFDLG
jgi:uncharacterized protein with PIN domain